MTASELDELLACYALDALEDGERRLIEARLAVDPDARARVAELERAVNLTAHQVGPPDRLWDAVARAAFPGTLRAPLPRRLVGRTVWRSRLQSRIGIGLAAAACLAALAVGLALAATSGGTGGHDLAAVARAAQSAPGGRAVELRGPDGRIAASAVVLPDGSGYLTSRLAALGTGRTYQLWAVGDATLSLGVLGPHPHVVAFTVVGNPRQLAITDEAAPGVGVSHEPPRAAGDIPNA